MPNYKHTVSIALTLGITLANALGAYAACCYFAAKDKDIDQPGQKAFITWDPHRKTESFTVQPKFEGNALDFGMVIPTPARPKLDEMPRDFFKDLAIYTILMPLPEPIYPPMDPAACDNLMAQSAGGGPAAAPMVARRDARKGVTVLESGVVGSLDYKIILATDAHGLFDWLKENKYSYSGDQGTLNFYIQKKAVFTVMKIDPKQMKTSGSGSYTGEVTPTRFTFTSNECMYPLKITQISVRDKTDALFYVQAPAQMDLSGDRSWMPSYRVMYLTYMLGCGASPQEQAELNNRNQWLEQVQRKNSGFTTTKLEWAKKLGPSEMSVLEDPVKNYAQMGTGNLPPGSKIVGLAEMLSDMKVAIIKQYHGMPGWAKDGFARYEDQYQPAKGVIIKHDPKTVGKGYIYTAYEFYPARTVPLDDIKGLSRLKGQLHNGMWLTKFRRQIVKGEMNDDLTLATVSQQNEQTYIRIMPTSPP